MSTAVDLGPTAEDFRLWEGEFRPFPTASGYTVTDLFAGAGGSSSGMAQIPGVTVKIAANHWAVACDIHNRNHQDTDHAHVDLHEENPAYFPYTDILWASPECTKWSQANGSKLPAIEEGLFEDPLSDDAKNRSRLLMFDVLRFIEHHRYRLVFVENVVDIATQDKYKLAWQVWRQELRALGYKFRVLSINSMHAQTYGPPAPQSRDRIYIAAWPENEPEPDFEPILRPKAYCTRCETMVESQQAWKNGKTVGRYRQAYVYIHGECGTQVEPGYLPAAAAIDWTDLGTPIGDRLAEKTRLRIAAGIARYWGSPFHLEASGNQYDAADPKHPNYGDPAAYYRAWSTNEVIKTLHTRETKALAVPAGGTWNDEALPLGHPLRTITTRETTGLALAVPLEGREGKEAMPTGLPFRTQTTRHETGFVPLHVSMMGTSEIHVANSARPVDHELRTLTATGNNDYLLTPYYSNGTARTVDRPVGALTTHDRYALVTRHNTTKTTGAEMTTPMFEYLRTLTTTAQQSITSHPRKPTVRDIEAALRLVPECNFRMFKHLECAAGMAFSRRYIWKYDPGLDKRGRRKKMSDRDLVKATGNAVCPPNARDLMGAGVEYLERCRYRRAA